MVLFFMHKQSRTCGICSLTETGVTLGLVKTLPGVGWTPCISYMGICHCEGYGFKQLSLEYGIEIREFLVEDTVPFTKKLISFQ